VTATFEFDGLGLDARGRLANGRWSLCLGAGINGHLMPDWLELARRVVNKSNGTAFDLGAAAQAWPETCMFRCGCRTEENDILRMRGPHRVDRSAIDPSGPDARKE
jgi:hypothetical protein